METTLFSSAPEETIGFAESFAKEQIKPGIVVALRGELGAGKTHFVKGIARALGIDERELTSPTFALVHEFDCELNATPFTLNHLDCYRFEKPEELLELGIEDYLYPKHAATIVEWPERIESLLPRNVIEVTNEVMSQNERRINIYSATV